MKKNKNNSGFTLVEMLVTVFVFSIIMTIAGSIFVQALDLQRRAFSIQDLEETGRFALETMAREIRFGDIQTADSNCPSSPSDELQIMHPVNGDIIYRHRDTRIVKVTNGTARNLVFDQDLEVTNLRFCVSGVTEGDNIQPKVTILISLSTGKKDTQTIDLQTTVTQRFLND